MIKMRTSGIYGLVVKSTSELYAGKSCDIGKRWSHYSAKLKAGDHNYAQIQRAYDNNDLGWVILEECADNEESLVDRENWWFKNAEKMGYRLINKERSSKVKSRVKDTSKMKAAQTGENNGHNTKLSVEDVKEIKNLLNKGAKIEELAKQYCVSPTHISNIKLGKRWSSVEV